MKIRYPIISIIALIIAQIIIGNLHPYPTWFDAANAIIFVLIISCLGLIAYLILRNIIRAIRDGAAGGRTGDYSAEARRACEKVTPKKDKKAAPPWEG